MNWIYPGGLPVALSLVGYNALLTSFFIWLKRRDRVAASYSWASFFIFGWAVGLSFMSNNDLAGYAVRFWGTVSQACFFLMPVAWLHFVFAYTGRAEAKKILLGVCYGYALLLLSLPHDPWFIVSFRAAAGIAHYPVAGPVYKALSVLYLFTLAASFLELHHAWKKETSILRKQDYRLFFSANLFGYGLSSMTLLPVFGVNVPQFQLLILPLWQFFLAHAMVRRHLMDYEELAKAIHRDKLAVMSTVAASMHHEIKNPLFIIHGSAETFLHKLHAGEFKDKDETILKAEETVSKNFQLVLRIMDIIQSFSRFAKAKGGAEPRKSAVFISGVVREVLPLVRYQINKFAIQYTEEIPENLPALHADPRQLEEILFNLLANACHAVDENGAILVRAGERGNHLFVQVEDNGRGIAKEHLRNIFDPFFTTREEGTGLGLYITRRLVEQNGGTISVESKPGRGSVFTLLFQPAPV